MDLSTKKILVTGASGFVGQHVMRALHNHGVPEENILAPRSADCNLLVMADCEKAVKGIDVVIHLAALTGDFQIHKTKPVEVLFGNMVMGLNLMEAAQKAGVEKFVTAGSVAEYPADVKMPAKEDLWNGSPESIHAPYAEAKRALLLQGQSYRKEYSFNVIHLLLSTMYGPYAKPDGGPIPRFIEMIAQAKKRGDHEVVGWGTGKPTRDFVYVEDVAEAIVLAVENYDNPEPVNIGSGKETSLRELADMIARIMDFSGTFSFDPTKSNDETRRVVDISRAKKEFWFREQTSLEEGLRKTIEWYNEGHGR